jgi:hypothetical protein
MSDTGRKGFGEKAEEKITPQSQKSTTDKISEGFTDTTDKVARYGSSLHDYHEAMLTPRSNVQPSDNKSASQSVGDTLSGNKDDAAHGGTGDSVLDKAKGALGLDKH